MTWQDTVVQTVSHFGMELIELERSAGGLLRVTIDWPWQPDAPERFITVDDCEVVTRQLQYALEVDGLEYRRLEVASPGIDRPLRDERDFARFVGSVVDLVLKDPIGAAPGVAPNRKKFRGTLEHVSADAAPAVAGDAPAAPTESGWQIVWRDEPPVKPGQRVSRKRVPAPLQVMRFELHELREARLAPIVSFKGRSRPAETAGGDAQPAPTTGE